MSRRITFFALAVSATLIATQASADRECFEESCRHSEIAEPTTSSVPPAAAADEGPAAEASAPAVVGRTAGEASAAVDANATAPKLAPARALPQVVATPEAAPVKVIAARYRVRRCKALPTMSRRGLRRARSSRLLHRFA